jgi:Domain of unknown function (DUF4783)
MKQIYTSFLLSAILLLSSFKAQQGIDEVVSALKSGNATELARYLDDNVELTLPEKSDSYSKAQAQVIIKDFFSNNGVKGFELKHKGTSPGGNFAIGTLQTSSGNFRTNIFMRTKNGKDVVKEIRFQSID